MSAAAGLVPDQTCFQARRRWQEGLVQEGTAGAVPITTIVQADAENLVSQESSLTQQLASINKFTGSSGSLLVVPHGDGGINHVFLGTKYAKDLWAYAALPGKLPTGTFKLSGAGVDADAALLGWALGSYSFDRYKTAKAAAGDKEQLAKPQLVWPAEPANPATVALAEAFFWARDLINTPAEDMGPQHMEAEAAALAAAHPGASFTSITGDDLLAANYPAVHTVGRASSRPPVLIDVQWAPPNQSADNLPLLALVGKGVCFDTGGYDIKPAAGMKLMKVRGISRRVIDT